MKTISEIKKYYKELLQELQDDYLKTRGMIDKAYINGKIVAIQDLLFMLKDVE